MKTSFGPEKYDMATVGVDHAHLLHYVGLALIYINFYYLYSVLSQLILIRNEQPIRKKSRCRLSYSYFRGVASVRLSRLPKVIVIDG